MLRDNKTLYIPVESVCLKYTFGTNVIACQLTYPTEYFDTNEINTPVQLNVAQLILPIPFVLYLLNIRRNFGVHIHLYCTVPKIWQIDGILPKGPYPPCLRMADRALLAGYHRNVCYLLYAVIGCVHVKQSCRVYINIWQDSLWTKGSKPAEPLPVIYIRGHISGSPVYVIVMPRRLHRRNCIVGVFSFVFR